MNKELIEYYIKQWNNIHSNKHHLTYKIDNLKPSARTNGNYTVRVCIYNHMTIFFEDNKVGYSNTKELLFKSELLGSDLEETTEAVLGEVFKNIVMMGFSNALIQQETFKKQRNE